MEHSLGKSFMRHSFRNRETNILKDSGCRKKTVTPVERMKFGGK